MPTTALWQTLHNIADRARPQFKQSFISAIAKTKQGVSMSGLQQALSSGDFNKAWSALNWEQAVKAQLTPAIRDSLVDIIEHSSLASMKDMFGSGMPGRTFDIMNERIYDWVDQEGGSLIQNITQQTKEGINQLVREGFLEGQAPPSKKIFTQLENAAAIRESLGLNKRQMGALNNYRAKLARQGITGPAYNKMIAQYKNDLLVYRAETIARSETIAASFAGQQKLWEAGTASGAIDPTKWEVEWLVTPDDFTCKLCLAMKGKRRPINGFYPVGRGRGVPYPPLHPRCRCTERLVPKRGAKVFGKVGKPISATFAPPVPGFGGIGPASPRTLEEGLAQEEALAEAGLLEQRILAQGEEAVAAIQREGAMAAPIETFGKIPAGRAQARTWLNRVRAEIRDIEAKIRVSAEGSQERAVLVERQRVMNVEKVRLRKIYTDYKKGILPTTVTPPPPVIIKPPVVVTPPVPVTPTPVRTIKTVQKELRAARRQVTQFQTKLDELKAIFPRTPQVQTQIDELSVKLSGAKMDRARLLLERRAIRKGTVPPPPTPPVVKPPPPPPVTVPPPVIPPIVPPPVVVPTSRTLAQVQKELRETRRLVNEWKASIRSAQAAGKTEEEIAVLRDQLKYATQKKNALLAERTAIRKGTLPKPVTPPPVVVPKPTPTTPPPVGPAPTPTLPPLITKTENPAVARLEQEIKALKAQTAEQKLIKRKLEDRLKQIRNERWDERKRIEQQFPEGPERQEAMNKLYKANFQEEGDLYKQVTEANRAIRGFNKTIKLKTKELKLAKIPVSSDAIGEIRAKIAEVQSSMTRLSEKKLTEVGDLIWTEVERRTVAGLNKLAEEERDLYVKLYRGGHYVDATHRAKYNLDMHGGGEYVTQSMSVADADSLWWQIGQLQKKTEGIRRDAIVSVIREIRPVGGKISGVMDTTSRAVMDEVQQWLPTDWISKSNHSGGLSVNVNKNLYDCVGQHSPRGGGSSAIEVIDASSNRSTYMHEFMHRVEYTFKDTNRAAHSFHNARTAGEHTITLPGFGCKGKADKYFSAYCGREYPGGATEILSMGMQRLFYKFSEISKDEHYIKFLLGVLGGV